MSEHTSGAIKGLPENAYKELKPGEEYNPLMPASTTPKEITPYSVVMGLMMAVLFSAAAAYLGLKIGQVFEAAIPIAIIAVGVSTLLKIKGPLGQNVIIQSIGQNSGLIVAGAIFTIPALYILNLEARLFSNIFSFCIWWCTWHSYSLFHSENILLLKCTASFHFLKPQQQLKFWLQEKKVESRHWFLL